MKPIKLQRQQTLSNQCFLFSQYKPKSYSNSRVKYPAIQKRDTDEIYHSPYNNAYTFSSRLNDYQSASPYMPKQLTTMYPVSQIKLFKPPKVKANERKKKRRVRILDKIINRCNSIDYGIHHRRLVQFRSELNNLNKTVNHMISTQYNRYSHN